MFLYLIARLISPSIQFAFVYASLHCTAFKFFEIMIPKYFSDSTSSSGWPHNGTHTVYIFYIFFDNF